MTEFANRYDFVFLFDVQDGNPNGDPDAGNLPRIDPETGHGIVTDVCLKRKVRNHVLLTQEGREGYDIFVKEKAILNELIEGAHEAPEVVSANDKGGKTDAARKVMCRRFFDVRTFGAVMSTGKNAGQVRGPVQLTFARSIDPVLSLEHSITRMAVATPKEAENQSGENRTMGRKATVPYALYRCHGFVSPAFASGTSGTGFSQEDFEIVVDALKNLFENDRSAARGLMTARGLYLFKHDSRLGRAQASDLFDRVRVHRETDGPIRAFAGYRVEVDDAGLPEGVSLTSWPTV